VCKLQLLIFNICSIITRFEYVVILHRARGKIEIMVTTGIVDDIIPYLNIFTARALRWLFMSFHSTFWYHHSIWRPKCAIWERLICIFLYFHLFVVVHAQKWRYF